MSRLNGNGERWRRQLHQSFTSPCWGHWISIDSYVQEYTVSVWLLSLFVCVCERYRKCRTQLWLGLHGFSIPTLNASYHVSSGGIINSTKAYTHHNLKAFLICN
ncbi:hypothetical protein M758_4G230100 [Ceratodon purpureus]|nr:hypothetical protein M758_4G230100 [Ceratodon purpureus]